MSHPFYNPLGGTFPNNQRPIVHGQYGSLGSQSGLELGAARLGPGSMSTSRGGSMVNQQMPFALGRQTQISQDLEANIDRNVRGAHEEFRLLTQILQQPKTADPRLRKDTRDEGLSSGRAGYPGTGGSSRSDKGDWSQYQAPSRVLASSGFDRSSSSTQVFQSLGFSGSGASSSLDSQPPPEQRPSRYTPESASSVLASFGLSNEDLELLSHYPDYQLTPDNLPVILRDIRMRKVNRSVTDIDARSELMGSDLRHGKVIDYGHFSKLGYPEESTDGYAIEHLPNESPKYGREVSGPPFSGMGITKRPQPCPAASGPAQVLNLQKPPPVDPRTTKTFTARPSASQSILPSSSRPPSQMPSLLQMPPPQLVPQLGVLPLTINDISGGPSSKWTPFLSSPISSPAAKRLPTPTMMNDYSAATPRIFPHTCSLCIIECVQIKDWIEHQNTNLHIERCRLLRKQYPDWNVEAVSVSRPEPKSEHSSLKRRTHSHSYSRSPSPKRHHDSASHRKRSRSRSQSPRRYRHNRRTRVSPNRRRSRSPPSHLSKSPGYCSLYSSSKRSPTRRSSPRRSSPSQQRSSSSERLAKKLMSSAELSSIADSSTLKAVVESLAPALLAELAKKRSSSTASLSKGSSSSWRRSSSSPKRNEPSRSSRQSTSKTTSSLKDVKPKSKDAPCTTCLLRLLGIPQGTTSKELTDAIKPFGKIYTAILLKAINEASVCMEREEDAKALLNCKNLTIHGQVIEISMEKDARDADSKNSVKTEKTFMKKEVTTKKPTQSVKDTNTVETPLSTKAKESASVKTSPVTKSHEKPSDPKKSVQTAEAKPPAKGSERPVTKIENEESLFRVLVGMEKSPVIKKPQAKGAKPPGKSAATEGKPNTIKAQSPAAAATTASTTDGAATSVATPSVGTVSAQDNMTAVPHITTDKVAPTGAAIMTEETSTPEIKEMDTHNDTQTDNETVKTPDTDSVKTRLEVASSVPNAEPAVSLMSSKAEIEVGSSIISSESAVADVSEKAELELAPLGLLEEPAILVETVNVKHELDTPVPTTESAVSIDTADQNKVSPVDNQNIPKDQVISKELVLTFVEDKEKLAKDSDVELKLEMEVAAITGSSGETQMEAMETQSQEELTNDHKPTEPFESEINPQPSDQIQPGEKIVQAATASDAIPSSDPASGLPSTSDQTVSESAVKVIPALNSPETVPLPFDDMTLDFPPVTQEILKAFELTVHQCHMQSSLKHAEQKAKQMSEAEKKAAEKTTNKVPSSSKKPPSSDKADKAVKKATQSESKSVLSEKEKRPQNSRTRSRQMDTLSPEEAASKHRSRGNSEDSPSRRSTPLSGSSSRKRRHESSSPSKRSRGHVDDRRSHSKSSQPSRSRSKTSKIEKASINRHAKEEETELSEEPFPFNIDEFVTVDEVGDDAEDTVTLSSESLAKDEKVQDDPNALSTISSNAKSTPANEPKQKTRSRSTTYKTRSSETKDPKVIDTPGKIETKTEETKPVAEVVESQKQKANEPQEESMDNQLETVAVKPAVVESENTELYTHLGSSAPAEENPSVQTQTFSSMKESTGIVPTQPVSSSPVQKEDCQPTSTKKLEKSENGHAEQSETSAPDMEDKDEATVMSDLPSHDAMVTLDEVSEGEEDFPEAADEEQHSVAKEVPEAPLTVDEVVDEETGGEEYQLDKEIQGLVTLDELVEEHDSFNNETLVTLDEAKGDDEEIVEVEQSETKPTSPNFKTPPRPEEPVKSPSQEEDACDLEEFCTMNFVTVDEVGEEEEEQPPSEEVKVQEVVKKTATSAKKRARQTSVRRSTRGTRDAAKSDKESDEPEMSAEGEPAPTASKPESPPSASDPVELDEPDSQKAETVRVPDSSSTEVVSSGSEERTGDKVDDYSESKRAVVETPVPDKKTTIKEESKRLETETREEPEAKKICSHSPVIEDFTLPPYSPGNPIGADFVVPKMGFFCRVCTLFYENEETAKKSHCGSLRHYQNMEKYYKKLKSQQQRGKSALTTSSQNSASK